MSAANTSLIGQDILPELKSKIGQMIISLTCNRVTLKFPVSTIPGDRNVFMISDDMPNFHDDEQQGGGRGRGCTAEAGRSTDRRVEPADNWTDRRVELADNRMPVATVRPEQVERQKTQGEV